MARLNLCLVELGNFVSYWACLKHFDHVEFTKVSKSSMIF